MRTYIAEISQQNSTATGVCQEQLDMSYGLALASQLVVKVTVGISAVKVARILKGAIFLFNVVELEDGWCHWVGYELYTVEPSWRATLK